MPVTNRAVVEDTLRVIRKTHSYIAGQKMTLAEWQDSVECLYWLDSMEARLVEDLAKEA